MRHCAHKTPSRTIRLPTLDTLQIETPDTGWLNALNVPALRQVTIQLQNASSAEPVLIAPSPIETLILDVTNPKKFTKDSLRTMSSLKYVCVEKWGGASSWEQQLLAMFFQDSDESCPQLEWVEFIKARPYEDTLSAYIIYRVPRPRQAESNIFISISSSPPKSRVHA